MSQGDYTYWESETLYFLLLSSQLLFFVLCPWKSNLQPHRTNMKLSQVLSALLGYFFWTYILVCPLYHWTLTHESRKILFQRPPPSKWINCPRCMLSKPRKFPYHDNYTLYSNLIFPGKTENSITLPIHEAWPNAQRIWRVQCMWVELKWLWLNQAGLYRGSPVLPA